MAKKQSIEELVKIELKDCRFHAEVSSLDEWGVNDSMIKHDVMSMHSDDDLNSLFRKYNS